jgi:hypothetical protein
MKGNGFHACLNLTRRSCLCLLTFSLFLFTFAFGFAQVPQANVGVIRLKVKVKSGELTRDLPRKRFFLIKGSLDDNKALIEKIKQTEVMSRECYYRSKGASESLINWLKENDCESAYCREVEERYVMGNDAVPEFKAAYDVGLRSFKSPEVARRWIAVNLSPDIRAGFYSEKQKVIGELIKQAEASTRTNVLSVMTDRVGSAYVTNIEPGMYTISNLVGSEAGTNSIVWICEKQVKPVGLTAAIYPVILSSEGDPKTKCEIVKRPLPVCIKTATKQ